MYWKRFEFVDHLANLKLYCFRLIVIAVLFVEFQGVFSTPRKFDAIFVPVYHCRDVIVVYHDNKVFIRFQIWCYPFTETFFVK